MNYIREIQPNMSKIVSTNGYYDQSSYHYFTIYENETGGLNVVNHFFTFSISKLKIVFDELAAGNKTINKLERKSKTANCIYMRRSLFVLSLFISTQNISAQQQPKKTNIIVDSLKALLSQASKPIQRFKILSDKAETTGLHSGQLDSANCLEMLRIAQELKNDSLLAISYNLIGEFISRIKGDNTNGLEYYFKAIPLAEKSKDKRRLSSIYFDISLIYFTLQNNEESVNNIRKGGANLPAKSIRYMILCLRNISAVWQLTLQPLTSLILL